jgi:hypothetical protein
MVSCENCTKGFILPGEPVGSIVSEFDGAYFSAGPVEGNTKRSIVLLTDIFGLPLVNPRLIADHLAKSLSCDVWVPDIFNGAYHNLLPKTSPVLTSCCVAGEPPLESKAMEPIFPDRAGVPFTLTKKLRMMGKILPRIGVVYRNRPSVVESRILTVRLRQSCKDNHFP